MHRKITIFIDEAVNEGIYKVVGFRKIIQFIENLVRPHFMDSSLDDN